MSLTLCTQLVLESWQSVDVLLIYRFYSGRGFSPGHSVRTTSATFPSSIRFVRVCVRRAAASTRVLVTLYFRLKISISGCSFFATSIDELLEFMET